MQIIHQTQITHTVTYLDVPSNILSRIINSKVYKIALKDNPKEGIIAHLDRLTKLEDGLFQDLSDLQGLR